MELKGKRINFLGDSITEGVGIASVEDAYWNLLKNKTVVFWRPGVTASAEPGSRGSIYRRILYGIRTSFPGWTDGAGGGCDRGIRRNQ